MTLLSVCQAVALDVGIEQPAQVLLDPSRTMTELAEIASQSAEELIRRVDWGDLTKSATLTGDGAAKVHALPGDFSRIVKGVGVKTSGGAAIRPVSRAEWNTLAPAQGTPRFCLITDTDIQLWPYLANAATATVFYQSLNFCSAGPAFTDDTNTIFLNEDLLVKLMIVRWRRQKGMEFADWEAEYEEALAQYASFDNGGRE